MFNFNKLIRSSITIANRIISRVTRITFISCAIGAVYATCAHAQTVQWTKYASEPIAASVKPTCNYQGSDRNLAKDSAGNFYVAGGASESGQGAVIYKFSGTTGALLWRKNYVGAGNSSDCATSLVVDSIGNVVVTGYTSTSNRTPTSFVVKYNGTTGDLLWNVVTGFTSTSFQFGYIPSALAIDAADNIIATNLGTTKYNGQTGAVLWTTRTAISSGATGKAIVVEPNGDVYIVGQRTTKLASATGAELWSVLTPTETTTVYGNAVRLVGTNELVVTGYTGYGASDSSEIVTVKYSRQTGAVIWLAKFKPPGLVGGIANDVSVDLQGNILVTGYLTEQAPSYGYKLTILKYAGDGTRQWAALAPLSNTVTGEGSGFGSAVTSDANGNVFVTGYLLIPDNSGRFFGNQWITLKLDGALGIEQWRKTFAVPNGQPEGAGVAIMFDSANDPVVLGYAADSDYRRSAHILSYSNAAGALKWDATSNSIDAMGAAQSAAVDNSGNLFVAGTFGGYAADNSRIKKYDGASGQELWNVTTPFAYRPLLAAMANGDILFATSPFTQPLALGISVKRYSSVDGHLLWDAVSDTTTVGTPTAMTADANGDVYVTGSIAAPQSSDARTVKFNGSTGAEIWRVTYAGAGGGNDSGSAIAISPDGHIIVASWVSETTQDPSALTLRVEKRNRLNGDVIWASTLGLTYGVAPALVVDATGNVFVSGTVKQVQGFSTSAQRIAKYDGASGALLWTVDSIPGAGPSLLSLDALGNLVTSENLSITKRNSQTGSVIWTAPVLGADVANVYVLGSGQIVASGSSYGPETQRDMRVVLYDGVTGSPVWSYAYDGGASANDDLFAMVAKGNSIFLAGSAQRPAYKPSWFVQKLSSTSTPAPYPLNLITNGTGGGSLAVSPLGAACEPTCNGGLHAAGALVTITPTPRADSAFVGWSGACTGAGACQVTMSKAQFVAATFNFRQVPLNIAFVGSGVGVVVSTPAGLSCTTNCGVGFAYYSTVTLRATANSGSTFIRWGGACFTAQSNDTCTVQIGDVNNVTANFSLGPAKLYVVKTPSSISSSLNGNVTSTPNGINCGSECFYTFPSGTSVTLAATPLVYSTFEGWGGYPGCAGLGPCTVIMNGDVTVAPVFKLKTTTIVRSGTGTGMVRSDSGSIDCGPNCTFTMAPYINPVMLIAAPVPGSIFVGWSGGCSGRGVCTPALGTTTITATFDLGALANDFSADFKSDLLLRNTSTGQVAGYLMNGISITNAAGLIGPGGWTATHTGDLNGDGKADILWRHTDGTVAIWLMNGLTPIADAVLMSAGSGWRITHVADLNGDGKADILWQHTDGRVAAWTMNGSTATNGAIFQAAGSGWSISHAADLNGDGKADIIWTHTDGRVAAWLMNGLTATIGAVLMPGVGWRVTHIADLDGDGKADILWQHADGRVATWLMNGLNATNGAVLQLANSGWSITHTADLNADGKADILWQHTDGRVAAWTMNGTTPTNGAVLMNAGTGWSITQMADFNGDGKADIVWKHTDGRIAIWQMDTFAVTGAGVIFGPGANQVLP
jgi:FG-GAP-like repeat/Divergent InlB B-repeat domain